MRNKSTFKYVNFILFLNFLLAKEILPGWGIAEGMGKYGL
jgi:hypothetical protein